MAEEGGAALKGLRLATMDRGPEGYGFHMYTNKELKGQYVKWISPNGPADLNGMLAGDHIIEVDGVNVLEMSHHEVVQRIRGGNGKGRTFLVIDQQTEKEMKARNEPINAENAIVMISRSPSDTPASSSPPPNIDAILDITDGPSSPVSPVSPTSQSPRHHSLPRSYPEPSSTAGLTLDMQAARPQKRTKRAQVKQQDWRSAVKAYNAL